MKEKEGNKKKTTQHSTKVPKWKAPKRSQRRHQRERNNDGAKSAAEGCPLCDGGAEARGKQRWSKKSSRRLHFLRRRSRSKRKTTPEQKVQPKAALFAMAEPKQKENNTGAKSAAEGCTFCDGGAGARGNQRRRKNCSRRLHFVYYNFNYIGK